MVLVEEPEQSETAVRFTMAQAVAPWTFVTTQVREPEVFAQDVTPATPELMLQAFVADVEGFTHVGAPPRASSSCDRLKTVAWPLFCCPQP
jgi:hypothetical protein